MAQAGTMRRGVAWLFAGNVGDQLLNFAFGIVLARLLAPEVFGLLLTIRVFTGLAGFVAGGGMGQALVRAKTATQQDYDIVFTLQLLIGSAIYAAFFFAAPWFARWYDNPIFVDLLRLTALSFLFRPFLNMPSSLLYRQMRFKAKSLVSICALLASSLTSITLAWLGHGVWSLVWGGIVGSLVQCLLLARLAQWRPGLSTQFARGKELARYGILVSANDLADYLRGQVSTFILSRTLGPQSLGLYNKGESLGRMPFTFVSGSVYQVLFRAMAAEQDNTDRCRYMFVRSIMLVAVYGSPFYVGLFWLAEPLVRGLYGPKWAAAAGPLSVLIHAWPLWILTNMSGAVMAALNRLGIELRIQLVNMAATAGLVVLALPHGIVGVAWAVVAAAAVNCMLMLTFATRAIQIRIPAVLRAFKPALLLNAVLAAVLWATEHILSRTILDHDLLHVAVIGAVGGVTYAAAFLLLPIAELKTERERWKRPLLGALARFRR